MEEKVKYQTELSKVQEQGNLPVPVVGGSAIFSHVFNEDCVQGMKRWPDKYFDLAVVDPPYGININRDLSRHDEAFLKKGFIGFKYKEWDLDVPNQEYFTELMRVSQNQIIWGGNYFIDYLYSTRCFLIWDKKFRGDKFADCEIAWTSFKNKSTRIFEYAGILANKGKIHPTQKPTKLYDWIFANYTSEGNLILDTHLGSGSSRIAAHKAGLSFVGYEIDREYYEAAERGFKIFVSQGRLW